jgi:uncharacterized tellurite resistance protein B-like protein
MIIFGTQPKTSTIRGGEFYCPSCETRCEYSLVQVTQTFSLFFVPVLPLGDLAEYVECQACDGTFKPEVLNYDPQDEQRAIVAEYQRAIRRVTVQMMLADGTLPEEAEPFIRSTYSDLCGIQLEHDAIAETISEIESDQVGLNESLRDLSASLNDHGKESVMQAAFSIATADFKIAPSEIELLKEIGSALRMTPAHVEGVIQTLFEEVGATPRTQGS